MKGLVNLKNKDIECFKWCHVRFINLQNRDPDIIKKQDKKIASTVDYRVINFPMKTRDYELKKDLILMKMFLDIKIKFFCYMFQKKSN